MNERANGLQLLLMQFVVSYIKEHNQPVPLKIIISQGLTQNIPETTTKAAIRSLVKKSFIRKTSSLSKAACYVQIRSL